MKLCFSPIDSWVFSRKPPKEGPEAILKANGHEGLPGIYIYICNTYLHGRSPSWFIKKERLGSCTVPKQGLQKSPEVVSYIFFPINSNDQTYKILKDPYFNRKNKTSFPHPPARRLA